MGEKPPSRIFRTLQILIPLLGVGVGITGVLLTVAARKKELTCTLVNSTRLVSENLGGINPDMHVEFHGQPIFSLTKMTFDVRNTGAAAIMAKDVVEPVRLVFPQGARLMSAIVERTFPSDLKFSARTLPESNVVELDFPLLNRGDEAFFSVYVFNSETQRPALDGRVVDVPQLIYSDTSASAARQNMWPFQSHATRSVVRWVLVCIYGGLTGLFLGLWVGGIVSYAKYLPWKRKWKHLYDEAVKEVEESARQKRSEQQDTKPGIPEIEGLVSREEAYRLAAARGQFVLFDRGFAEELSKKGIPEHPHPTVETIGGLAGFSGLMIGLALVSSTTALVAFRGLGG